MDEEPTSPCGGGSWVSMAMRVRHQLPHHNMLYQDLRQILPPSSVDSEQGIIKSLKELSIQRVLASDNLSWHLACSCPTGMFDFAMEMLIKELALRYRFNSGQRLQYNLTRSIVRLSLHCIHDTLPLLHFLRQIPRLFHSTWFRWSSCRYHPSDDVAAMWAFYAELADAMAVGYVVPRLYERSLPCLPHLDLSGIPRLRDSTWSLRNIYDAGNKELNPKLGADNTLQLTMDLGVEGLDRKQLRLLHKLAMDRRKCSDVGGEEGKGGKFLVGLKQVYVTSLAVGDWDTLVEDITTFPELTHLTLNMCSLSPLVWEVLRPLAPLLTGLALPNNPDLNSFEGLALFSKLQLLDLSNLDLRGLLSAVTSLPLGLSYLCLSGCRLRVEELALLASSPHAASLLQLDLSENSARGKPDLYRGYVSLLETLEKVEVLNVSHCHLPEVPAEVQAPLEAAVRALSSLRLLAISSKDFTAAGGSSALQTTIELMDCKVFYTL